ncbi:MAG TPA: C25 family cysteine peptidase, partial [bacterium]|nr:C25 family cysteine peptidase [bacterium]
GGYTVNDVDSLDNYDHLTIAFGYACSTGVFDTENPECPSYGVPKCMAEAFVLNPGGGAVVYYGASRTAFAGGHGLGGHLGAFGLLDRELFRSVGEGHTVQGRLWLDALLALLLEKGLTDPADHISLLELHLFGDPTLAAGGSPDLPEFELTEYAFDDTDEDHCAEPGELIAFMMRVTDAGAPAHNVTISLTTPSADLTIETGSAALPDFDRGASHAVGTPLSVTVNSGCPAGSVHEIQFTVTSDETSETFTQWLFVGDTPHLTAEQLWITTDTNNDNIAGPGESVKFAPGFLNIGCMTASGITSTITIDDPWVTDYGIRGDGVLPDLAPGVRVIPQKLFYLELDPLAPDGHEITCDMAFSDATRDIQWDISLPMTVHDTLMPVVSEFHVNPAVPDPGQEVTVTVRMEDPAGVAAAAVEVHGFEMDQPLTATLLDDGQHGDGAAGDMIFGARITLPDKQCYMSADVSAEDTLGNAGTVPHAGGVVTVPFVTDDPILVIGGADDDLNLGLYTQALDDAGYGYDVWSFYRGLPPNDILDRYVDGAVILYFSFTYPYLDQAGRDAVDYYLAQGGNLLITEQDIGWVMIEAGSSDMADWYHNTLLADYMEDNSGCHAVAGTADFNGLNFSITGGSGANNQDYPSLIEPIAPAETCFVYSDYSGPHSGTAGIRAARNGARHIYLAYGFEGIAAQQDRADAMDAMMAWFGIAKTPRMCPFNQSPGFWIGPELPAESLYGSSAFCESDMRIYMAGGLTAAGQPAEPSIYALDTVTHQSMDTGADLQAPRFYHATACLDDHGREKIYFIGGLNSSGAIRSDIEVYDPVENSVSVLSSDPLPAEIDGIPGSCITAGNRFYIIGLARMSAPYQVGDTWVFDPMADPGQRWSTLTTTLEKPRFFGATAAMDGRIYLMGGVSQESQTEVYAHTTVSVLDTTAATPAWDDNAAASMPSAMFFNAGAAIPGGANVADAGRILVCAGIDPGGANTAYWYDPATDTWTETWPVQNTRMLTGNIHVVPSPRGASVWIPGGHYQSVYTDTEILHLGNDSTAAWIGIRTYPETVIPGCCLRVGLDLAGDKAMTPIDCYVAMEVAGAW